MNTILLFRDSVCSNLINVTIRKSVSKGNLVPISPKLVPNGLSRRENVYRANT